jgi:2-polyprenyl-3-methyl-5-hydroxy-6-metoxy-1,4-benzoquinol methylase
MVPNQSLRQYFGNIDIYLFDELLKGSIRPPMKVLDAGCGGGRNVVYLLRAGFAVCGVDESEDAIRQIRGLANSLAPKLPQDNFASSRSGRNVFCRRHF